MTKSAKQQKPKQVASPRGATPRAKPQEDRRARVPAGAPPPIAPSPELQATFEAGAEMPLADARGGSAPDDAEPPSAPRPAALPEGHEVRALGRRPSARPAPRAARKSEAAGGR